MGWQKLHEAQKQMPNFAPGRKKQKSDATKQVGGLTGETQALQETFQGFSRQAKVGQILHPCDDEGQLYPGQEHNNQFTGSNSTSPSAFLRPHLGYCILFWLPSARQILIDHIKSRERPPTWSAAEAQDI